MRTRDALEVLWPLSESFEYVAELGLAVREHNAGWWQSFVVDQRPSERYGLPQAQGFAFWEWLQSRQPAGELLDIAELLIANGAPRLASELQASVDQAERHWLEHQPSEALEELSGQPVKLYAPVDCFGYPHGSSSHLDTWTHEALQGATVTRHETVPAIARDLVLAHEKGYVRGLFHLARQGGGLLTPETMVTAQAQSSVLAGAGAVIEASRRALAGESGPHVCLVRPGSHHAERARGGGTCLINNLAVAARWALRHRARAVAIIDLDAHHGNGTEQIFRDDPSVFTTSVHQAGHFFPGTGGREEVGRGLGRNTNLNLPVSPDDDWLGNVEIAVAQAARHSPQLVLVEYSTDAHECDPVSDLRVTDAQFAQAVRMIYSLRVPVVFELGASLSERAWLGGLRALIQAAASA